MVAYTQQTWADGSAGGTPISAARLNHMEAGIKDASYARDATTVQIKNGAPGADDDMAGTEVTWGPSTFTIDIPSWANSALVMWFVTGAYATTSSEAGFSVHPELDGVDGSSVAFSLVEPSQARRFSVASACSITGFSTGTAKTLRMRGVRTSGTGVARLDTLSDVAFHVTFKP